MRSLRSLLVLVCALAACGSDVAPKRYGPAKMLIVSGNNQVSKVGAKTLGQPVRGQLYRNPDGTVAFRWYDAVLPAKAYAQTVVKGAPVVGAVVCWADVPNHPRLIPFSICNNTNDSGLVAFNLAPDTVAGDARGQIHWDSAGHPIVTDSVQATVNPGPPAKWGWLGWPQTTTAGDTIDLPTYFRFVKDAYGNPISEAALIANTKLRYQWRRPVETAGAWDCAPATAPQDSGWKFVAADSLKTWPSFYGTAVYGNACLWLWIGSDTANAVARFVVQ